MISTVSLTLCRIALRRPNCGSVAMAMALGAPTRCGEPVRASWLGWAGSLVGSEAMFGKLFTSMALLSHHALSAHLRLALKALTSSVASLPSNDLGRYTLGNHTSFGLGGTKPAYQLETLIQERPMDHTIGRTIIQRIIQSGQRRTILALS